MKSSFQNRKKTIKQSWALLRRGLAIELESRIGDKELVYFGCTQRCCTLMLALGRMATVTLYDGEEFLESCVAKYCECAIIIFCGRRPLALN